MKIERVTVNDTEEILKIYKPYIEKTAITFEYEVPSMTEFRDRIASILKKYPYIKAVGDAGEILGYAYASAFKGRKAYDWSVETSIYVKESEHGKGIGRALYTSLEKALKSMGIINVNACISSPVKDKDPYLTRGSILFHEKCGFKLVGTFHNTGYKFDRWYDMIWMEKFIGEHKVPVEPVKFGDWTIDD